MASRLPARHPGSGSTKDGKREAVINNCGDTVPHTAFCNSTYLNLDAQKSASRRTIFFLVRRSRIWRRIYLQSSRLVGAGLGDILLDHTKICSDSRK
jgi:hypothetical protein